MTFQDGIPDTVIEFLAAAHRADAHGTDVEELLWQSINECRQQIAAGLQGLTAAHEEHAPSFAVLMEIPLSAAVRPPSHTPVSVRLDHAEALLALFIAVRSLTGTLTARSAAGNLDTAAVAEVLQATQTALSACRSSMPAWHPYA